MIFYLSLIILLLVIIGFAYYFTVWSKTQFFGYFPYGVQTDKKIIALTFDDGPNPPYTNELLSILAQHQVRATFFITGKKAAQFPDLVKAIAASGHIIGNHSYSHKFTNNFTSLTFAREIGRTQDLIFQLIGRRPALYRSPWLFKQTWLLKYLKSQKFTPVAGYFSSSWEAWHVPPQRVAADALRVAAPGRIIIFHDGADINIFSWDNNRAASIGAIDLIIPKLKNLGYEFVTADQLLGVPAYQNL